MGYDKVIDSVRIARKVRDFLILDGKYIIVTFKYGRHNIKPNIGGPCFFWSRVDIPPKVYAWRAVDCI